MVNPAYLMMVYFLLSVPDLLNVYHSEDEAADQRTFLAELELPQNDVYDYIIIGAGSAGGIIADRLSRDFRVLLLERGGNPTPLAYTPYLWLYLARVDPGSSMRYQTTPQEGYSLHTNGVVTLLQGRVLGGTSNLNQMVYTRGNRQMYNEWSALMDDLAWSYSRILELYKKFEDYHGTYSYPIDREVYGVDGQLYIEKANLIQPSVDTFFKAVQEKGLPIKDLNADQTTGFSPIDFNSKHGQRWGTFQAFLEPAFYKTNLVTSRYSTATKIHLNGTNKAYGVTYTRHGISKFATATREVIVSAGVFESPKLLMLSGIGPADELQSHGIQPIVDLPVGRNLQDHLMLTLTMIIDGNITFVPERDFTVLTEMQYKNGGTGPFRNTFATMGYTSSTFNNDNNYPDLQYFIQHQTDPGSNPADAENILRPDTNTIAVFLVRQDSAAGKVTLKSSDPADLPVIDPNYASDPNDIKRFVEGVKFIVDLYENSEAYREKGGARLSDHNFPAICKNGYEYRSDDYWACVVRHLGESGHHFVGTCSMGLVVDKELKVKGTTGLRVADASIMPTLPNTNTNAPAMLIGEFMSNLILPWRSQESESESRVGTKFRSV